MRLTEEEKTARRAAFRAMSLGAKLEYVFAYYKLPLVICLVVAIALGWVGWRRLTYREPLLYVAYANVALEEKVEQAAEQAFLTSYTAATGADARRTCISAYRDLYLSNNASTADHQYAYASKLKLFASIEAQQLDVVLMNQEAYDLLSGSGYLLDLTEPVSGTPYAAQLAPLLAANQVIISDNAVEYELNEAGEYEAELEEHVNALRLTGASAFSAAHLSGDVYLGVIANTPRLPAALSFAASLA